MLLGRERWELVKESRSLFPFISIICISLHHLPLANAWRGGDSPPPLLTPIPFKAGALKCEDFPRGFPSLSFRCPEAVLNLVLALALALARDTAGDAAGHSPRPAPGTPRGHQGPRDQAISIIGSLKNTPWTPPTSHCFGYGHCGLWGMAQVGYVAKQLLSLIQSRLKGTSL